MSPKFRLILVAVAASLLGTWVGVSIAQEEHFIGTMLALVSVWAVVAWTRGPYAEAWLLGFLVFGYVIGSRGFAQVTPIRGIPLFLGELGLVGTGALLVLRGALTRHFPIPRDALNGMLVLWFGFAAGRVVWDVRTHGFVALRDFATVYYVAYFFITQAMARHEPSRRLLHGALTLTFGLLPFTALLAEVVPAQLQSSLMLRGVPLIYYKDDLLATFLFAGFIYLVPKREIVVFRDHWRWLLALLALGLGFMQLSRAGMVGLAIALGALVLGGRRLPLKVVGAFGAGALVLVSIYSLIERQDFTQTKIYAVYEHVAAIADIEGTRQYANVESTDSGDNNRFRLVWWRTVTEETLQGSPVFGLGFGHDLARGFVAAYNPLMDDFSARSPHSILFTLLGRTGLVGIAVFLLILGVLVRSGLRVARLTRRALMEDDALTLHAVCWTIMISAFFGVVLEGPMGAVPFWIILGLAHRTAMDAFTRLDTPALTEKSNPPAPQTQPAVPVASGP